jgi:hypothetical protein
MRNKTLGALKAGSPEDREFRRRRTLVSSAEGAGKKNDAIPRRLQR